MVCASLAQLVEHRSRKAGVTSSSLVAGSIAHEVPSLSYEGLGFLLSRNRYIPYPYRAYRVRLILELRTCMCDVRGSEKSKQAI